MNWRTKKALYRVKEISTKKAEEYSFFGTGDEVSAFIKAKNEMNGYIPGLGGDRSYSCIAWLVIA